MPVAVLSGVSRMSWPRGRRGLRGLHPLSCRCPLVRQALSTVSISYEERVVGSKEDHTKLFAKPSSAHAG